MTQITPSAPPAPNRAELSDGDRRTPLVANVREAIRALPFYFESKTMIEGLDASDLFSLNSVLGGAIEVQLKGWYLLAKEKAPSYRYTATPDACSEYDLLVVVPWHLADVLSGAPVVRDPYVEQARYAAEMRNYYWKHQRGTATGTDIISPSGVHPYPSPKTLTSDKPEKDSGGNFGRVARVHGLMDDFIASALNTPISGIEARHWIDFFKVFTDASDPEQVEANMRRLLAREDADGDEERAETIVQHIKAIHGALNGELREEAD